MVGAVSIHISLVCEEECGDNASVEELAAGTYLSMCIVNIPLYSSSNWSLQQYGQC